jgi:hypothetical protein
MKRWLLIGTTFVLLAVLLGGVLRQQGVFPPAQSTASIKPADEHVMQYLQTLLETWKRNAQEPAQRKP